VAGLTFPQDEAALTHQAHRWLSRGLAPSCGQCIAKNDCEQFREGGTCILAETAQAEVLAAVQAEVEVTPAALPVAREYAKAAIGLQVIDTYLAHGSPFLPGAPQYLEPQPVVKWRSTLSSRLQSLAAELGLTPAARARLKTDPDRGPAGALAALLVEVRKAEEKERAATVEADFTAEEVASPDGGGGAQEGRGGPASTSGGV